MAKFKVGDKVRVVDDRGGGKAGDIATVTYVEKLDGYECFYRLDGLGECSGLYERRLELVPKFKVGDRVVPSGKAHVDLVAHWNKCWGEAGKYEGAFYVTEVYASGLISYSNKPGGDGPIVEGYCMIPAPLKLEAGKYYRTRNGKRVGPLIAGGSPNLFGAHGYSLNAEWYGDGRRNSKIETDLDIVAEWGEASDKDRNGMWRTTSFCVDVVNPTTPCIIARIENGQPKPAAEPHVHPSRAAAETEAGRLARKHKGREFGVYELVVTKQEQLKHEWQRLAVDGRTIDAIKKLREVAGLSLSAAKAAVDELRAA